ncbi:hypothetical protein BBJ28_00023828, partial [Nothophytophthora sp. Chile5]
FVFKNFEIMPTRISAVSMNELERIKEWLDDIDICFTTGTANLNWKSIMTTIRSDHRFYLDTDEDEVPKPAGWEFLKMEGSDDEDEEEEEAEDSNYSGGSGSSEEESESSGSDGSDWESIVDEESESEPSEDDDAPSWDELEKEAQASDRMHSEKRGREEEDEEYRRSDSNGASRGPIRAVVMQLQTLAYAISGAFTLLAIILSGWLIWTHLLYNPSARIRKHVIRILMMVPIYALTSYLALVFNESKLLFETVRDCYEAFALYSFHCFLVEYLGGQSVLASTMRSKPQMTHVIPFCCMKPWAMGGKFIRHTTIGILQYIPTKVLMSIITLITSLAGVYGEGEFMNPLVSYGYVSFILSISQTWALYCLVLFFYGAKEELHPMRPVPKFLAIKAIIFFTYWQSLMISVFVSVGVISERWHIGCPDCWDAQKIASALNDFVICVEMLGFAVAHHYAFAIEDFLVPSGGISSAPSSNVKAPLLANFMDAINVTDVSTDLKNSRNEILTKKQALAAKFDRVNSSPGGGMF